jgi:hypothetical protein
MRDFGPVLEEPNLTTGHFNSVISHFAAVSVASSTTDADPDRPPRKAFLDILLKRSQQVKRTSVLVSRDVCS